MIRDAEWVIRRVDRCPDGGYQIVCDGVSELVREREAIFLTSLDSDIQVLDPEGLAVAGDWIVRADDGDELVARLMQLAEGRDTP